MDSQTTGLQGPSGKVGDTNSSFTPSVPFRHHSFTYYPRLPAELRNLIWQHVSNPRIVTLIYNWGCRAYANKLVPVMNRVCQDSRRVFLRNYMIIGDDLTREHFNPHVDTLFLRGRDAGGPVFTYFPLYLRSKAIMKTGNDSTVQQMGR